MTEWFPSLHPTSQSLLAGLLTWFVTALGASLVLFMRRLPGWFLDAMLGFAAGVMIAASVWSLLLPAIDLADTSGQIGWLVAAVGFLLGGLTLRLVDRFLPHLHPGLAPDRAEGVHTSLARSTLLVLAITLHNIPEGLAVGVAFGAAAITDGVAGGTTLAAAVALTIGIALQNFPEGVGVAMPLRREGLSVGRSFWYGQLSGIVEPLAAVIGAAVVVLSEPILPTALAFAAGAMLFVVVEELIPESQQGGRSDLATLSTMVGFVVMMILDVSLG